MQFWQEYHRSDAVYLLGVPYQKNTMAMCLIAGDVNLDHLIKVVVVMFLHYKATIFPLPYSNLWKKCESIKSFTQLHVQACD